MRQNKIIFIVLIIIFLLLILSIITISFFNDSGEEKQVDQPIIVGRPENYTILMTKTWKEIQKMDLPSNFVVDDRINPYLEEQAISCEISRIRDRGIEEAMRTPGIGWRTPPKFYYVVQLDYAKLTSEEFSTWDTGFIKQEFFRKVNNGQENADVIISIFEEQPSGFLGLKSEYVKMETISLEYCFRTGRWAGDDYFNDSDGYGRFLGEKFEIWFKLRQSDKDGDGLPFWLETNLLMTDSNVSDSGIDHDCDGLPTSWEWWWGFDPFVEDNHVNIDISKDGLSNIEKYKLSEWFADPYQPEIYIEADFMDGGAYKRDNVVWEESKQLLIEKFSQRTYHLTPWSSKITVYVDIGDMGEGGEILPHIGGYINQESGVISEFYKNNFKDERKGVFRYLVMAEDAGWCHPQDYKGWYDAMCIGASEKFFLTWFRGFNVRPQLQRLVQGIQIMHELGHSLGLNYYAGIDNASNAAVSYWKNYQSCMNYHMMYRPFLMRFVGKNYGLVMDYSDGSRNETGHPDNNDWGEIDLRYFKTPNYWEGLQE